MTDELKNYLISNYGKYSFDEIVNSYGVSVEDIQCVLRGNRSKRCKYEDRTYESKLEIAEYRKTHSMGMTGRYFVVPNSVVSKVASEFNIQPISRSEELDAARVERFGSREAGIQHMIEQTKKTSLERYGKENFAATDTFIEKTKETCQERYGVDNVMQSDAVKKELMQSNIKRFGVPWPQMNNEILQKRLKTTKERYGGSGWASSEIRRRSEDTSIDRYGVTHWKYSPELTSKLNKTCQEKHGVDWPCLYPEVKIHSNNSKINSSFDELLSTYNIDHQREFGIDKRSYDFKVGNILIELNPSSTHNSTWGIFGEDPIPKTYHREKSALAENYGFRCIHVWDWDNIDKIVQLLLPREKIYARKCNINSVLAPQENQFECKYHLQNYVKSDVSFGLYYKDELVSLMTFGKPRYNNNYQWELLRYVSSKNVVGGAEKLFNHFIKTYKPSSIISYCDRSKFTGNTYSKLGFKEISCNVSRHWYNMSTGQHFTDNLVRQRGVDQLLGTDYGKGQSNDDLLRKNKFVEIYDAGQSTYVLTF